MAIITTEIVGNYGYFKQRPSSVRFIAEAVFVT